MYHIPDYIDSESDHHHHRHYSSSRHPTYTSSRASHLYSNTALGPKYPSLQRAPSIQSLQSTTSDEWTDATSNAASPALYQTPGFDPAEQISAIGHLETRQKRKSIIRSARAPATISASSSDEDLDTSVPRGTRRSSSSDCAFAKRRGRPDGLILSSRMDELISASVGETDPNHTIIADDGHHPSFPDVNNAFHDRNNTISPVDCQSMNRHATQSGTVSPVSQLSDGALTADGLKSRKVWGDDENNPRILHFLTRDRHMHSASLNSVQLDQLGPGERSPSLTRSDIGQHLIPSRQSSLKPISEKAMSRRRSKSAASSHENEGLAEDEDSDVNNATLRRIRELQEARGRRQREWKRESRRSERTTRRHRSHGNRSSKRTVKESASSEHIPSPALPVDSLTDQHETTTEPVGPSENTSTPSTLASGTTLVAEPDSDVYSAVSRATGVSSSAKSVIPDYLRNDGVRGHRRSFSQQFRKSSSSHDERQGLCYTEVKTISDEVQAFLRAPRLTQRIRHPLTGRTIAFSEVGDPQGAVVICCVGMGLTRYVTSFYDELARTMKLRLITPDRPGVGGTQAVPDSNLSPLHWVDDVATICSVLEITRFSLLAHSAGAIYALATALKMPQYIRGRIHLLAPWIPPSQMPKGRIVGSDTQHVPELPFAHKFLSILPTPILRVANSRFLAATSASVEIRGLRAAKGMTDIDILEDSMDTIIQDLSRANIGGNSLETNKAASTPAIPSTGFTLSSGNKADKLLNRPYRQLSISQDISVKLSNGSFGSSIPSSAPVSRLTPEIRQDIYNKILTHRVWELATKDANPANDLMICFERRRPIGFRYSDVSRSVVIHHGAKDNRVPLDNIRWLQTVMKRCELRVLNDEGHGLMASANVMSSLLTEIGKEWEEWEKIANAKQDKKTATAAAVLAKEEAKAAKKGFRRHFYP